MHALSWNRTSTDMMNDQLLPLVGILGADASVACGTEGDRLWPSAAFLLADEEEEVDEDDDDLDDDDDDLEDDDEDLEDDDLDDDDDEDDDDEDDEEEDEEE